MMMMMMMMMMMVMVMTMMMNDYDESLHSLMLLLGLRAAIDTDYGAAGSSFRPRINHTNGRVMAWRLTLSLWICLSHLFSQLPTPIYLFLCPFTFVFFVNVVIG